MAGSSSSHPASLPGGDDEEEDYMSDAFLAKCVGEKDVRPGLKMNHATKREHEALKKKQEAELAEAKEKSRVSKIARKTLEEDQRKAGLDKRLDTSNKGFAMLQKMGYKQGESLGKDNTGRVDPIPIEVKAGRSGLGREAAVKQIHEAKSELRRRHAEARAQSAERQREMTAQEFRTSLARKNRSRRTESDLYTSQKTCHQLDTVKGFTDAVEPWFWPEQTRVTEDEEDVDTVKDEEEVKNPPTGDREFQSLDSEDDDEDRFREIPPAHVKAEQQLDEEEFSPEEKLGILTGYLRSQYHYCLWCGISYSDSDEIRLGCPGDTREDHDD